MLTIHYNMFHRLNYEFLDISDLVKECFIDSHIKMLSPHKIVKVPIADHVNIKQF